MNNQDGFCASGVCVPSRNDILKKLDVPDSQSDFALFTGLGVAAIATGLGFKYLKNYNYVMMTLSLASSAGAIISLGKYLKNQWEWHKQFKAVDRMLKDGSNGLWDIRNIPSNYTKSLDLILDERKKSENRK